MDGSLRGDWRTRRNDSRGSRKPRKFPSLATRIASRHSIRSVCCGRGGSLRFLSITFHSRSSCRRAAPDERTERVLRTLPAFQRPRQSRFRSPLSRAARFSRELAGEKPATMLCISTSRHLYRDHCSVDRSREAVRARARETVFTTRSIAATVLRRRKEYK